jgi:peptidoglycan/LPS O-acetylase OafA/YrhL
MNRREYESGVEGLRGFAALCVLYTHFFWSTDLDPGYEFWPGWAIFEVSMGAVLLFFILSGYVIGLTNTRDFSPAACRDYFRRRLIRLVPLCWLAVGLSVLVKPGEGALPVLANLAFLQNKIPYGDCSMPILGANTNLWTLNYEALYYLAFVLVWWRPRLWPAWLATALAGSVAGWLLPGHWAAMVSCYALGWIFWLCGFALARGTVRSETPVRLPWPSILLLWVVVWQIKPLWSICRRFSLLPPDSLAWANYAYIDFLPASLVLMLAASDRRPRWSLPLCYLAAGIPLLFMVWVGYRGRLDLSWQNNHLLLCILAVLLWKWRPDGSRFWSRLAGVGSISFGLYVLQRPVQWLVHDATWLPGGNLAAFGLRLALALAATFLLAWWAEKKLQPWIRRKLTAAANPR